MDVSHIPHAERVRRKNRSSTNVNHLSLAPLTTKLPLDDDEAIADAALSLPRPSTSYLQGKSAPATPRLLASSATNPRSRSRSRNRTPSASGGAPIPKSKSSSHLAGAKRASHGAVTPRRRHDEGGGDGDWLLRTGALMTFEAREFKGQSWLVSRQSSTSLTGIPSIEDVAFEDELAREREMTSLLTSRRGSLADDDMSVSILGGSKIHSRSHSNHGSRSQLMTPAERVTDDGSYFPNQELAGPDFVDLDERLEELERDTLEDAEADVKRLMRRGTAGKGSWMTSFMGWSLFSVDEQGEETDDDDDEGDDESEYDESLADSRTEADRSAWLKRHVEGPLDPEDFVPPPTADEGSWSDAAWLLSVASKVIF
ncbi:uncharacterized protein TRIREDRAFT_23015 [Trichoderma reesei QM6a]|jgi:hypothetical protein|uniref:Predicted protein n=2 Tax=Hypocrea jecorina TaxID=51453 RepID=G0RS36_HYPJQ|nr:uncharacterized protein TRIREDRAFT_23015 [Trichoderma reesei QM6a]EGR46005.1 predicted protein [Trichoderma reesei QM6a]